MSLVSVFREHIIIPILHLCRPSLVGRVEEIVGSLLVVRSHALVTSAHGKVIEEVILQSEGVRLLVLVQLLQSRRCYRRGLWLAILLQALVHGLELRLLMVF